MTAALFFLKKGVYDFAKKSWIRVLVLDQVMVDGAKLTSDRTHFSPVFINGSALSGQCTYYAFQIPLT